MTAHELARALLAGDDLPVYAYVDENTNLRIAGVITGDEAGIIVLSWEPE